MKKVQNVNDPHVKLQHSLLRDSSKVFGVIKRECIVTDMTSTEDGSGTTLHPGNLIEITPEYWGHACYFKIRVATNWLVEYKTSAYKCTTDDYTEVTRDVWQYLLALKNDEGRIKFAEIINSREFDVDLLKLDSHIRIRGQSGTMAENYYEFVVKYIGAVNEIGRGHYIGLQFKIEALLTPELYCFSRYYRFGGVGIVVPADWIFLNLYKDENTSPLLPLTPIDVHRKPTIVEKCRMCSYQAETQLAVCRHSFCRKCLRELIKSQALDPRQAYITCTICGELITESDINAVKLVPNPIDRITLNDQPFYCGLCDRRILIFYGVILARCRDSVCLACFKNCINQKLLSSQIPTCPICQMPIEQFEVDAIVNEKLANYSNSSGMVVECLACEENFEMRLILKCLDCANSICLKCVNTMILAQNANNTPHNCPFCPISLDEFQIAKIKNTTFSLQRLVTTQDDSKSPQLTTDPKVIEMFSCVICEETFKMDLSRTLFHCKDRFCRQCITEALNAQFNITKRPTCPLCSHDIAASDIVNLCGVKGLKRYMDIKRNK